MLWIIITSNWNMIVQVHVVLTKTVVDSVTVNTSPIEDYTYPKDHIIILDTYVMTPRSEPFEVIIVARTELGRVGNP